MYILCTDINLLIINFLPLIDYLNYSLVNHNYYTENKLELQYCLVKHHLNNSLLQYQYQSFRKYLTILRKFNISHNIVKEFNLLLSILFNQINSNLPAIWLTSCAGYYDIRYLYLLLKEGGKINKKEIKPNFSNIIYDRYYDLFITNHFNINNICLKVPYDTTLAILQTINII